MSRTLPLAGSGHALAGAPPARDCGTLRPSHRARWRALVLILVHVAVGAHILHWFLASRTMTPLEPSEAIETIGRGLVNAGFVLFLLLILSTLVLGRFFCGWGCHIVALQDLCGWLLRRAGIRPRPFRSRLLVFAPIVAAIWMFGMPAVGRWMRGVEVTAARRFVTDDFWSRFPGWTVALLTFAVCGFLIVYLLGNKGFCTYGCPYGGIFGIADRFAIGRIRVTDACEGCGHCTATCTSNVKVHEEVRLYRAVVDPGCMKCMDCVNVCPKDALYFGFGAPSLAKGAPRGTPRAKHHDYTWPEEIAMAVVFLGSAIILSALYEAVPLLLGLGLAAIGTWLVITCVHLLRGRSERFLHFPLRGAKGLTGAGMVTMAAGILWALFLIHSGTVRYLSFEGLRRLEQARALLDASEGDPAGMTMMYEATQLLYRSEKLGFVPVVNLWARLGIAHTYLGEHEVAEEYYRRAVDAAPDFAAARYELARFALARHSTREAIDQLTGVLRAEPEFPGVPQMLVQLLAQQGRAAEAVPLMEGAVARRPESEPLRLSYALALAGAGEPARALELTGQVVASSPANAEAWIDHAGVLVSLGDHAGALAACNRAVELAPENAEWHFYCSKVAVALSQWDEAVLHLMKAQTLDPRNATYVQGLAIVRAERERSADPNRGP